MAVAVTVVLGACGTSSTSDTPEAQRTDELTVHPTLSTAPTDPPPSIPAETDPSPTDTASPSSASPTPLDPTDSEQSERRRSDRFFRGIGIEAFEPIIGVPFYESLRDITFSEHVDLIVRGTITDIWFEEVSSGDGPYSPGPILVAWMTVTIEEVLKGTPARTEGSVEIHGQAISVESDRAVIEADLPDHEVLLFLSNTAAEQERGGDPPWHPDRDWYTYAPDNFQGVLRNIDGRVRTIDAGTGRYPDELEGLPFDDVLARVREIAGSEGGVPGDATSELERSDAFWGPLTFVGDGGSRFDSLADVTRSVHVIVRGRITDVTRIDFYDYGGDPEPLSKVQGTVAVDEVLKGSPEMRIEGTIELMLGFDRPGLLEGLIANVPSHEHVFFLMNDRQWRVENGFPPRFPEVERYRYGGPNYDQYVLRGIDGRVEIIEPEAGRYPADLDGLSFEGTLDRIRAIVEG